MSDTCEPLDSIEWRWDFDLSWGSAEPVSLPAGAWAATPICVDERRPSVPLALGIAAQLADQGVDPNNSANHLFDLAFRADRMATVSWPRPRTSGETVTLTLFFALDDGVNRVATGPILLVSEGSP